AEPARAGGDPARLHEGADGPAELRLSALATAELDPSVVEEGEPVLNNPADLGEGEAVRLRFVVHLVLNDGAFGKHGEGVGVAGAPPGGGGAGLDLVDGVQDLARRGRAVLQVAFKKAGHCTSRALAAGAGIAGGVPVEFELHRSSPPQSRVKIGYAVLIRPFW